MLIGTANVAFTEFLVDAYMHGCFQKTTGYIASYYIMTILQNTCKINLRKTWNIAIAIYAISYVYFINK